MTIVRWDPFRNVATLQDRINRIFNETFPRADDPESDISMCEWKPAVDIFETDEGIIIRADLPGVSKDDVSVEIKDNTLTLRGDRLAEKEANEYRYFRKERSFGSFHRAFTLQSAVHPDKIKAKFANGVLEVQIPKPEKEKPKQITVDIE